MALLLLSLGLGLVCAQDFNPRHIVQRNYDISKVSGTWYSISMAADNRKRIEEDGDLRIFIEGIQVVEDGGLKLSFHFMLHAECTDVAVVCGKTGKSGEYTINYLGENSLRILEADYQRYVILHMRNFRNGTATQVLALYGTVSWGPSLLPTASSLGRSLLHEVEAPIQAFWCVSSAGGWPGGRRSRRDCGGPSPSPSLTLHARFILPPKRGASWGGGGWANMPASGSGVAVTLDCKPGPKEQQLVFLQF
ncbi:PREDICTED: epididymal-specific lipocalin-9-like [Bison bison bison]|uniref:Epididymal-specific lipocalin-9-like n=1 Tax=Bison bison bison TaxID=43346 RepID=A0A6P3IUB2_BISBB|nr:PREDICTED: epididymal-specific lipocalin-9-like [Bison bison bison]